MSFQLQISPTLCFSVLLLPSRKEQNLHFDCKFRLRFVSTALAQQQRAEPTLWLQVLPALCQYCFGPAGKSRTYTLTASFDCALSVLLLPSSKEQNLHFDCKFCLHFVSIALAQQERAELHSDCKFWLRFVSIALAQQQRAEPTLWLQVLPALCQYCFGPAGKSRTTLWLQVLTALCQYCFGPAAKSRTYTLTASFACTLSVLLWPSRKEQNYTLTASFDCALSVLLWPSRKEQNLHFDCKFCLHFVSIALAQQERAEPTLWLQVLPVLCQYCFCPAGIWGKNRTYILTAQH